MHRFWPALVLSAVVPAQSLVSDIATSLSQPSSGNMPFYVLPSRSVFVASGAYGLELYGTDGTAAGTHLLKDLRVGLPSFPSQLVVLGNEVLFVAGVEGLGSELWKSDGTTAGTVLVKDIRTGTGDSLPEDLIAFNGYVWFGANDGVNGGELWRSDGTEAGTTMVADLASGAFNSFPRDFTVVGNELYFTANFNGLGRELYKSDANGTLISLVADLSPGASSTVFSTTGTLGNLLLFGADTGNGLEPHVSDGTLAGTFALADLEPGSGGSLPTDWTVLGNLAVFTADTSATGLEPYVTDGTIAGTMPLGDLNPGSADGNPAGYTDAGGVLVFAANTPGLSLGREVYRTDGTAAGTFLLADLHVGLPSSNPSGFTRVGNRVWFSAEPDATIGNELHRTDGIGVQLVNELVPGFEGFNATDLTVVGNRLLCRASWGDAGVYEPVITDGTVAGTELLADIAKPGADSSPNLFAELGDELFFFAKGDGVGSEPHRTTGSTTGATLLADLVPGILGASGTYRVSLGDEVLFDGVGSGGDRELFATSGTLFTTTELTSTGVEPKGLAANGNLVVFSGESAGSGREPWVSDGTAVGTFELLDIGPGGTDGVAAADDEFVTMGGLTFFAADDGVHGKELWATDGTTAGTFLVADIAPGSDSSNPSGFAAVGDTLYFSAFEPVAGNELWKSDGTLAGTVLVADLRPGFLGSGPASLTPGDGVVYCVAGASGNKEIYVSDGTTAGTFAVTDSGTGQSIPYRNLTWTDAGLFYLHDDMAGHGRELWRTNGTLASTQLVLDLVPGYASGIVEGTLTAVCGGTQLMFAANDLEHGLQLWRSGGTAADTQRITSFGGPGYGAVSFGELFPVGAKTYFAGHDGLSGVEPWVYDPEVTGVAYTLPYGTACSSAGATPQIGANGLPTIGNAAFEVTVAQAVPLTFAIPAASGGITNLPLGGGCNLLVASPVILLPAVLTDVAGTAASVVAMPSNPSLAGADLFFQWAVLNPGGPFLGDFDLSDGLQVQAGS